MRAIITDNHATNVSASRSYIVNLGNKIMRNNNIRNNLSNSKWFVIPPFDFIKIKGSIYVEACEISWSLLLNIYEKGELLPANLKKAIKLSAKFYIQDTINKVFLSFKYFPCNQLC